MFYLDALKGQDRRTLYNNKSKRACMPSNNTYDNKKIIFQHTVAVEIFWRKGGMVNKRAKCMVKLLLISSLLHRSRCLPMNIISILKVIGFWGIFADAWKYVDLLVYYSKCKVTSLPSYPDVKDVPLFLKVHFLNFVGKLDRKWIIRWCYFQLCFISVLTENNLNLIL